ncbi:MAG: type II toxin-antitoxin system PemK/MazF family toxin [Cyclobacteriaceae bacterium]|jgi:mRNA interferase MazF
MKQGEIWFVDLNPTKGSEQAGQRPVVVISGNLLNEHLTVVIVVPLTTKIKNYKGNPILNPNKTNGLKTESEMLVFHVRSVSKDRLVKKIGSIQKEELNRTIKTLNDILKY